MNIYAQRAQVPGSVIIDGGSGYCKFGWSKYASPSRRTPTFLDAVRPSRRPVVVSVPICHYDDTEIAKGLRQQLKECIQQVLFDMNVPAICAINQATLALHAARQTSGIVVNIRFQVTSVVPILNGKVMRKVGVEVIGLGALKFELLYTIHTLKENLCYVAPNYKDELSKVTKASLEIPGEVWFTLSKERFQTGEILFQPCTAGVRTMALDQAVAHCMDHCCSAELSGDDAWFKTVFLTGGTACLPGLAEKLEKELHELLPPSVSGGISVIPPHGADTSWFGAKLISNLSTFPGPWCMTKKEFHRKARLSIIW